MKIIFKCINGKKIGIEKKYAENSVLINICEQINDKKNGKTKEYYENGQLSFEGEFLNDKKNGKVKEYYENGQLLFEGKYLDGKRNGKGKNIITMMKYYLKENIQMEIDGMVKVQNIMELMIFNLKGNI